ncbi:MAG: ACT domain-containing protein [Bacillota bacterium]|uniref:UPF0237 protein SAMN02745885_00971 n=2 Tax=Carboxydocella TaxID=178898 RepID=A0A1T4NLR5_9FIRM|nr:MULTISPECIES: ACT domain-containing protein [Carboxydocella]AVX20104.1 ACT domain-containing protein [Carboxydocella thermautotrophica]AVX30521.1 ACT domain-containing protein [Carboxydocella thermautotrophica]SJZ80241.1 ACT domain-containing protein [Carboxydocella sporoproducens DSM 16521]GAW28471.1 hypothetical protein ULO1_10410 [Carboxydocella sp. ULO1]GAW31751.1 hypothetical protein JDF658_15160 [Carboxydocella sp. JDF658]
MKKSNRAIVTVLGQDRVGIIAGVTGVLAGYNVNILDIRQTIMQEFFTMMMLVDLEEATIDFSALAAALDAKGQELGVQVRIQQEDIFRYMHRI